MDTSPRYPLSPWRISELRLDRSTLGFKAAPFCKRLGFSLIEILVAVSVLALLVTLLASILSSALNIWSSNELKSGNQQNIRAAVTLIQRDLEQMTLPTAPDDQEGFQLLINPPLDPSLQNKGSIFFQAPVATRTEYGKTAIVGYFVRKGGDDGKTFQLCRLLVNPGEEDYQILSNPTAWLTPGLLDKKANPSKDNHLQGLLIENVPGFWVTAYVKGDSGETAHLSFDSRLNSNTPPTRIQVSLALLDDQGAQFVKSGAITLRDASEFPDAQAFLKAAPASLQKHLEIVTLNDLHPF